jgi:hypothetical protein
MDKRVTMIQESDGSTTAGSAHDSRDDTIELEMPVEQELALSRATEADQATARPVPEYENFPYRRTARIDFICNVTSAAAVLGIAVAFLWPASVRHPPATARAPAVTGAVRLAAVAPAGPAEPQGAPVRIRNAFDATEVFEFPNGTTKSEARKAVAELLLSRARDRLTVGPALSQTANLQPDRGAALQQPEVLVTRLLAGAKETLNGTR